jgi:hypothetical protein
LIVVDLPEPLAEAESRLADLQVRALRARTFGDQNRDRFSSGCGFRHNIR